MKSTASKNSKEESTEEEDSELPHCQGCQNPIEEGQVVQFNDNLWHMECFCCDVCHKPVDCHSNLLLSRNGGPICENCSYTCKACGEIIKEVVIMTDNDSYHANCFRCVQCNKRIGESMYTQIAKRTICTECYDAKKQQLRAKKRDEKSNIKKTGEENSNNLLIDSLRSSSNTSILNSYVEDYLKDPVVDSKEINELNDILLGKRNSEEFQHEVTDSSTISLENDTHDSKKLKEKLNETRKKLKKAESELNKIKSVSRKALEEFQVVKESYLAEVSTRKEKDRLNIRLKSEVAFYQHASIFNGPSFIQYTKEEIEELYEIRGDLEQSCYDLRSERDHLLKELELHSENIEKLLISQKPQDLHWERLQHAYQQQLNSMQKDMTAARNSFKKIEEKRNSMISYMEMLIKKNDDLTEIYNEISRKMAGREQEAKALNINIHEEKKETKSGKNKHKRNLSTGSIDTSMQEINVTTEVPTPVRKLSQRDSFNGSAAPKLFKFGRNKSQLNRSKSSKISEKTNLQDHQPRSLEPVSESGTTVENKIGEKHHFGLNKFLRPTKCEVCNEKMWRVTELRCSECHVNCHSKCMYSVPQNCSRKNSTDSNGNEDSRHMFGNDLVKQVQAEKGKIPLVVEACIEAVKSRGMDYEGIYRKSGGVGQMRQIQVAFEKGETPDLNDEEKWNDICAVTSVLKQYFRELPNPLFTYELHSKFMDAIMLPNISEQIQTMTQLIQTLPIENFDTLKCLMTHLYSVQENQKENLMTSKNLAVIFGPTLLRHREENRDLLEMTYKIGVIEFILNNVDKLFTIETLPAKSTHEENRKANLQQVANGEDLSVFFANFASVSALPAVPPRENAGYI